MICYHAIVSEVGFYLLFGLLGWGLLARLPAGAASSLIWLTLFCVFAVVVYVFFLFVVAMTTTGGYAPGEGSCGPAQVVFLGFWSMALIAIFYGFAVWRHVATRRNVAL